VLFTELVTEIVLNCCLPPPALRHFLLSYNSHKFFCANGSL
jgi:hypothetical protein